MRLTHRFETTPAPSYSVHCSGTTHNDGRMQQNLDCVLSLGPLALPTWASCTGQLANIRDGCGTITLATASQKFILQCYMYTCTILLRVLRLSTTATKESPRDGLSGLLFHANLRTPPLHDATTTCVFTVPLTLNECEEHVGEQYGRPHAYCHLLPLTRLWPYQLTVGWSYRSPVGGDRGCTRGCGNGGCKQDAHSKRCR